MARARSRLGARRPSDLRAVLAAAAIGSLALAGCASGSPGSPPPSPSSVEPALAYAGSETPVVIRGSGFHVRATVDVGSSARVDAGYRAWMGGVELADVQWIDGGTLSARIPSGLARGRHDLAVEGPFGRGALVNAVELLEPPVLDARASHPTEVAELQEFDVALDVENATSWVVESAVADVVTSGGIEPIAASGGAQDVPAGGSARWQWRFRGTSPGDAALVFTVRGTDPRTGAAVVASAGAAVVVKRPASLAIASLVASPDPANLAQDVFVEMVVSNSGAVDALAVAPSLAPDPVDAATWIAGPTPPSATIPAGGASTFSWRWSATARGALRFSGGAAGVDALSLSSVAATARDSAPISVQRPAALVGDVAAPARVNFGQLFDVALAVTNVGEAVAAGVSTGLSIAPAAFFSPAPPAGAPVDLGASASTILTHRFQAIGAGPATVHASATASDATDRRALTWTGTKELTVDVPAELGAAAELVPARPLASAPFELRMTVTNRGEAIALGVSAGTPSVLPGSTAAISPVAGPTRESSDGDLSLNEAVTFSWTFDAVSAGTLGIAVSATAVDANDDATRTAAAQVWTEVVPEVQEVAANALGDASRFAFVTAYDGDLVVGPSGRGDRLVRMEPDGVSSRSLTLAFPRDVTGGNTSENHAAAAPPYRSIGYYGCVEDTVDGCGPDDENGRGLLASFTFGASEWLLLAGARLGGDLDYVYVTRDTGTTLSFSYVDLSQLLGGNTRGISAARVIGTRLYLGFPDNGGNRPYGLAVLQLPTGTGLDAVPGVHAIDLRLDEAFKQAMTDDKFASIAMVDAIGDFGGRVYFLNDVGCIVSKVAVPSAPTDFANCSPTAGAAYNRDQSVEPTRQYDLEPWEKAWPQVAVWNGRLYAIRNLVHPTLGRAPQLWSCDPAGGLDAAACEPGDWGLVAADANNVTRFGNSNATAATMLVATARHLYVGFDDAGGVRIYRTSAPVPLTRADFEGTRGCNAADAGCAGFGGNGLGAPATTRIFDAKALQLGGGTFVYVAAGNGTGPARVVRLPE